ncbi:hypothetical protein V2I01_38955 [Micromonospora sp. BRA006-A]|nr:hypothetical protein [Micromonospora sp. BRA006-A]
MPEPFGLGLGEAAATLAELVASPRFAGLSVTEINRIICRTTSCSPGSPGCWPGALTGR